jgi:hypothetical protein
MLHQHATHCNTLHTATRYTLHTHRNSTAACCINTLRTASAAHLDICCVCPLTQCICECTLTYVYVSVHMYVH